MVISNWQLITQLLFANCQLPFTNDQFPMSSFSNPHHLYLFSLKNGKKRLAYGQTPQDALEILSYRLSPEEMDEILREDFLKINQRKLQEYVDQLA